jgi:hypothetical protein
VTVLSQVEVTDIDDDAVRLSDVVDEATIRSLFASQRLLEKQNAANPAKLERHAMRMHSVRSLSLLTLGCAACSRIATSRRVVLRVAPLLVCTPFQSDVVLNRCSWSSRLEVFLKPLHPSMDARASRRVATVLLRVAWSYMDACSSQSTLLHMPLFANASSMTYLFDPTLLNPRWCRR